MRVLLRSTVESLTPTFQQLYAEYPLEAAGESFTDVVVRLDPARGLRRWWRPQVCFHVDGTEPLYPFAAHTHMPLLEWGLNYALAQRYMWGLLLHSGVVARNDRAVLMPAIPGSGKSTLTAALMCHGYRLLSDEFGAVSDDGQWVMPLVRPIALKNESISVIRDRAPSAVMGPSFPGTRKGTVAHLAPSPESVQRRHDRARLSCIVFPLFTRGSPTRLIPLDPATVFTKLAVNSFNYEMLGPTGFDVVAAIVAHCPAVQIVFGQLDEAIACIDRFLDDPDTLPRSPAMA